MEITGRIENWTLKKFENVSDEQKKMVLDEWGMDCDEYMIVLGDVFDDSKRRFFDGQDIKTSLLDHKKCDIREDGIVVTRNSVYKLGKPRTNFNTTTHHSSKWNRTTSSRKEI